MLLTIIDFSALINLCDLSFLKYYTLKMNKSAFSSQVDLSYFCESASWRYLFMQKQIRVYGAGILPLA